MAFQLIFTGKLRPDKDHADIRAELQKYLKLQNPQKIDVFFTNKPIALKKDLSEEKAQELKQLFFQMGLLCSIKKAVNEAPTTADLSAKPKTSATLSQSDYSAAFDYEYDEGNESFIKKPLTVILVMLVMFYVTEFLFVDKKIIYGKEITNSFYADEQALQTLNQGGVWGLQPYIIKANTLYRAVITFRATSKASGKVNSEWQFSWTPNNTVEVSALKKSTASLNQTLSASLYTNSLKMSHNQGVSSHVKILKSTNLIYESVKVEIWSGRGNDLKKSFLSYGICLLISSLAGFIAWRRISE
jgi:hypothetical protein